MKKILFALLSILLLFNAHYGFSANLSKRAKPHNANVNILTWWGYLDWAKPLLNKIGKICHANISFDDYYSNAQFMQRLQSPGLIYDIAIFSDTESGKVDKMIDIPSSTLYRLSDHYAPIFRQHYLQSHLPHNVVYFEHSLTIFIYNPKNIHISDSDSLYDVLKKAGSKNVAIVDDPTEANMIMSMALNPKHYKFYKGRQNLVPLNYKNFRRVMQNAHVFITNQPQHILTLPNTAFAFQWSGDAIVDLEGQKRVKLKLLIDPRFSYISSDFLAELNTKKATNCVARYLAGKKFLRHEENHTFYLSPYGGYSGSKNKLYQKTFKQIAKELPYLPWLHLLTGKQLDKVDRSWQLIKLKLASDNA